MSKRHAREHGRVLSVDEETLGSVLVADAASGATTLYVDDAAEFEDDGTGGWLSVNDQVIEYDTVDDDAGTIHLKTALTAAADDGDPVYVWSKLYATPATVKTALVMVDGEDDNTDPIHATLADAVQDLPEGLRGEAGESCTLVRVSDDEWEITAVGGRPTTQKGVQFEDQDTFTSTTAGAQAFTLSHAPKRGSVHMAIGGVWQTHNDFTVNLDTGAVSIPDPDGILPAGAVFDFRYAYLKSLGGRPAVYDIGQSPYTWPSEASAADDLAVLGVVVPTDASLGALNGWDQVLASGLVTHGTTGPTLSVRLYVFTRQTTAGGTPLPVVNKGVADVAWMLAVLPNASLNPGSDIATVGDSQTASSPAVPDSSQVLRIFVAIGSNPHITTTANVVQEDNPPRNTSAHVDYVNLFTLDAGSGAPISADAVVSSGWLLAALPLTGA